MFILQTSTKYFPVSAETHVETSYNDIKYYYFIIIIAVKSIQVIKQECLYWIRSLNKLISPLFQK